MYDPSTGRWSIEDPIGFDAGDMDLYRYVGNNPTNAVDPTGLAAEDEENEKETPFPVGRLPRNHDVNFYISAGWFRSKTSPVGAGEDSEGWWGKDTGGAFSKLRIYGISDRNTCNTPFQFGSDIHTTHAGSLITWLSSYPAGDKRREAGTYIVKVKVRVVVERSKAEYGSPIINLKLFDSGNNFKKTLWTYKLSAGKTEGEGETILTLEMNYGSYSDLLALQPSMSFTGDRDNYVGVKMYMRILSVTKKE